MLRSFSVLCAESEIIFFFVFLANDFFSNHRLSGRKLMPDVKSSARVCGRTVLDCLQSLKAKTSDSSRIDGQTTIIASKPKSARAVAKLSCVLAPEIIAFEAIIYFPKLSGPRIALENKL